MRHLRILMLNAINVLNFKLRALVWLLVGCTNTVIILLFWRSASEGTTLAAGMPSIPVMTSYYILLVTLGTAIISHVEDDVAQRDIQRGGLYVYLLKPYSYLVIKFQEEIFWRVLGGFWALLLFLVLVSLVPMNFSRDPIVLLAAVVSSLLCLFISYFFKMIVGMMAFWLTYIHGFMELVEVATITLMGGILPISLLPEPLHSLAVFSPFASMLYAPVSLFSGLASREALPRLFLLQFFWLGVMYLTAKVIYKLGSRSFAGVSQ